MAGSMGRTAEVKCNRAREIALGKRMPMIWLIDSAGARIQEAIGSTFAGSGFLFREESIMSGVVPMVAAMMGPGAAGTAYIPALADFVPMVKGTSHMALGGPPLVKAVVGEDVTPEELGGSKVHTEISGVADLEVADDRACIRPGDEPRQKRAFECQVGGVVVEQQTRRDAGRQRHAEAERKQQAFRPRAALGDQNVAEAVVPHQDRRECRDDRDFDDERRQQQLVGGQEHLRKTANGRRYQANGASDRLS